MANEITDYIARQPHVGMTGQPFYDPKDDSLTFYEADVDCYARRVDSVLTYYFAFDDDRPVGFEIKGVRRLLDRYRDFGIEKRVREVGVNEIIMGYYLMPDRAHDSGFPPVEKFVTATKDFKITLEPASVD